MKRTLLALWIILALVSSLQVCFVDYGFTQQKELEARPPEASKELPQILPQDQGIATVDSQGGLEQRPPEAPRTNPPQLPVCKEGEVIEGGKCVKRQK